jgi:ribonuclease HII
MRSHQRPTFEHETLLHQKGYAFVAGCDEAGRGAICGPIVAAAVILDPLNIPPGIDDSKRLSPKRRLSMYHCISETSVVGIAVADHHRVDRDNVLQASLWAMSEAVALLTPQAQYLLVDGPFGLPSGLQSDPIVGGDTLSLSIAAASIIAKVHRDHLMDDLAVAFPAYGFTQNRGYGTPAHLTALKLLGPSPVHRRLCACVAAHLR